MSFLFTDIPIPNPGFVHSGWRGSGSLAIGADGSFVPHYNIAALSDRQFVNEYGFIEGLIPPSVPEKTWLRPPGHIRGDRDLSKMRQHNLLATEKSDNEVFIWMVNESSDLKVVEEYITVASIEDDDFILSRDVLVSQTHCSEKPVEQLKPCNIPNKSVWIREKRKLFCLSSDFQDSSVVFQNSIKVFEEHNYLDGEVYILDTMGMLWSGEVGQTLGRTKNRVGDSLNLITQSNHPRVVYGANDLQVRTVDVREDTTKNSQMLFEVSKMTHRAILDGQFLQQPIVHIGTLPHREHHILAMNDRQLYLIDVRYPRDVLLTQDHSIPDAGHVLLCAEQVADSSHDGRFIHNQFFLDHGYSGVWMSSLYEQKSNIFSTIRPIHQMSEPKTVLSVLTPPSSTISYKADQPPRAISLVQGFKDNKNRNIDILMRTLDDGAVLYSKILYGEVDATETRSSLQTSRQRFMDWAVDTAYEMETWGPYYQTLDPDKACETVCVHFDVPDTDETWDPTETHPLDFKPSDTGCHFEPLTSSHPDAIISSSIMSLWNSLR